MITVGQELDNNTLSMELWDTVSDTITLVPYPAGSSDFVHPETLALDDETFILTNGWDTALNYGTDKALKYNINDGWEVITPFSLGQITHQWNGLYLLNDPSVQGFSGLNSCLA